MAVGIQNAFSYTYNNITTSTTTTLSTQGPGILHAITINTLPTGAATVTIFDSATGAGTKIGTIVPTATTILGDLLYDVTYTTGLTIVTTAATTPGDYTVCYR